MISINDIVQLDQAKFWTDNGILFGEIRHPDTNRYLNSETLKTYLKAVSDLCEGKKMPFLLDLRNTDGTFSNNAAKKLANSLEYNKLIIAEIFVINSLKMKLLISSYKRIYEPNTPFEIFEDYDEALDYSIKIKKAANGSN